MKADADIIEAFLAEWSWKKTGSGQIIIDRCPYCDSRRHLYASASTGLWICFKCNESGDLPKLYAELAGMTYSEALIEIKSDGIRSLDFKRTIEEEPDEEVKIELPPEFIPCFEEGRWRIPTYLKRRRVTKKTIKDWGIGFCQRGRYKDRIVIPVVSGDESTFVARAALPGMRPGYIGPEVDEGNGRRFLLGWQFARARKSAVLVEGPFDALRVYQAGFTPLALLGKGLGRTQRRRIKELKLSRLVVMLDSDAWLEARQIAAQLQSILPVTCALLKEGDPDDHEEAELAERIRGAAPIEAADRSWILAKLSGISY